MKYPFEASFQEIKSDPDQFVTAIFSTLQSDFLLIPKGNGFLEYSIFEKGYEALKKATSGFDKLLPPAVISQVLATPICLIVIRAILGFSPSEWAHLATQRKNLKVTQGFARSMDRKVRLRPLEPLRCTLQTRQRLEAMIETACQVIVEGPSAGESQIHRLQKADTDEGLESLRRITAMGVPYAMLLYERFLGRPFAGHRDSVSELVGDKLESAVEDKLNLHSISYRKTKRAGQLPGFDQAPDFVVPDEFAPQIVIEAKMTEDDGTARDKVTRIQHLAELSMALGSKATPKFEVIACIDGRGFGVRREDMRKMLVATRGKVFTLRSLDRLVECSALKRFETRVPGKKPVEHCKGQPNKGVEGPGGS